jgi:hypothetical protein
MKINNFWKQILILSLIAFFAVGVYIFFSNQVYRTGYPLDDAWIHQTFARNLYRYHQLAYFEGTPSAGSTSPLWSFFLSIGYLFSSNNFAWTMFLGFISLVTLGWLGERIIRRITPGYFYTFPWVGVLIILEWHFVWSAVSGMETLSLAVLSLGIFCLLLEQRIHWFILGLLTGLGVWIRPDASTLIGPIGLILFIMFLQKKAKLGDAGKFLLGLLVLLLPYLVLNKSISGNFWPNTFFAKQLEYRELLQKPIITRFWTVFQQHMVGMGILLLPGFIYKLWDSINKKEWVVLSFVIWWLGFLLVYTFRLPVGYQHGRYEIPVMPFYILISVSGVFLIWKLCSSRRVPRILSTAWVLAIILVNFGFFWLGARTYATDVAIIETEMVETSKWIHDNTPSDSLIAAHDIGALGYFGGRTIFDLAGLISPAVLPVIRDESGLFSLIQKSGARYLMTFPGWYPEITSDLVPIFTSTDTFSPWNGGENMVVYKLGQ